MLYLIAKLAALATFIGGPLFVADALKGALQAPWPFVIAFAPVGLLLAGFVSLGDDPRDRFSRFLVNVGLLGALGVLAENAYAIACLVRGAHTNTSKLLAFGIVLGSACALGYAWAAARFRRGAPIPGLGPREPGFGLGVADTLVFLIMLAGTGAGVWMWARGVPRAGALTLLFGIFFLISLWGVVERTGLYRPGVAPATLRGGIWLRPSRTKTVLMFLACLGLAIALFGFGDEAPVPIVVIAVGLTGLAVWGLVLVALGKLPVGALRFDPTGLTVAQRRYRLFVPWEAIVSATPTDVHGNPAALLLLGDLGLVAASPATQQAKAFEDLGTSLAFFGAHVAIMPASYGLDVLELTAAIERYRADRFARSELVGPSLA